jgi:dienelactone hydrolase
MRHTLLFSLAAIFLNHATAATPVKVETVEYKEGGTTLEGLIAYNPIKSALSPGIVVVHDWMGMGDYVKKRITQLAELGYVAFAADIYGKSVRPKNEKEASAQAGKYKSDRKLMRARVRAAYDKLKSYQFVDTSKMAVMGYCFGGTTALELARSGADLKGTISFHGGLETPNPNDAKNIKGKVLALHGADDPFVPAKEVAAFEDEMRNNKVDWELVKYGGAVHAFTVPGAGNDNSKGAAYNAEADKRSFVAMKDFFDEIFK